jgi:MerR family transcriptional regulator, thiopeptide resistance regulator
MPSFGIKPRKEKPMSKFKRVIPLLVYEDIPAAHDFLVKAFGFEPGGVHRDAKGQAIHGEVRVGDSTIWLHRVAPDRRTNSPRTTDMAGAGLVVHVADVDAHCECARAAGARIEREPEDMPYAHREYEAPDLEGHRWWFATPTVASRASTAT